jgi:hypothetical protein
MEKRPGFDRAAFFGMVRFSPSSGLISRPSQLKSGDTKSKRMF